METARMGGRDLSWGDTHHPSLSETDGDYDGEYLFINDKANPRIAVIDLRDFETKQIVTNPNMGTNHGGAFVTPNTEYVIEAAQYSVPLWTDYADADRYAEDYRGLVTMWKFDRESGRIDQSQSFSLELPPYWHDLSDAGKGPSFGWFFLNSFNSEMATGGIEAGNPPFEAGASQNDMDYMHVINWERAAELAAAGRTQRARGQNVITLETAVAEGILFSVPEPKSPHGADVTPDGQFIVVSGKLDPHVTVYSWEKIKAAIDAGTFSGTDSYGVQILDFNSVIEGQLEVGLGPLHTQFDDQGHGYTSIFLDTKVTKWSLNPLQVVDQIDVHYNVGHLAAAEGDTKSPDGKYLVSLNKW
jgi:nitrous-oxide reductase